MKINFVTEEKPGWVLRWISESYSKYIFNSTVSTRPDLDADINVYVNYALFDTKTKIDIGYFTHKEKEGYFKKKFEDTAEKVDWCIAMSNRTAKSLPKNKTTVILVPPDPQFMKKKIVFGIIGKEKETNRKRYSWVEELKKIDGTEFKFTNGKYKWKELPGFFKSVDYVLFMSKNEGGPIPLVEAIAMGKPVITTPVGFSDEYTHIEYKNLDELKKIIEGLIIDKNAWVKSTKKMTEIFEKLIEKNSYN